MTEVGDATERDRHLGILLSLIAALRDKDSWSGVTVIQKSVYMLQAMLGVDLGFKFVLYRYGPFARDLIGALNGMQADELVFLQRQGSHYGPKYALDELGRTLREGFSAQVAPYADQIAFVAEKLGDKDVKVLERLCTALFVTREFEKAGKTVSPDQRAKRLREYKPHIPENFALAAIREIDAMGREAEQKGLVLTG